MTETPLIRTAIPQRRYQIGDYSVSLLAEIDSRDGIDYRFILAFVQQGRGSPDLYVCCETNPPAEREGGAFRMRIVNRAMSEVLASSDAWRSADDFAAEALKVGARALGVGSEPVLRLM